MEQDNVAAPVRNDDAKRESLYAPPNRESSLGMFLTITSPLT